MTTHNHTLGFPRIGLKRELKKRLKVTGQDRFHRMSCAITAVNYAAVTGSCKRGGVELLPVGDFARYDHVLGTSLLFGNVPPRHAGADGKIDLDTLFRIARGRAPSGEPAAAAEMTKWFNTNYHYIVPEFQRGQTFTVSWPQLFDEVDEALEQGFAVKPVLLGP